MTRQQMATDRHTIGRSSGELFSPAPGRRPDSLPQGTEGRGAGGRGAGGAEGREVGQSAERVDCFNATAISRVLMVWASINDVDKINRDGVCLVRPRSAAAGQIHCTKCKNVTITKNYSIYRHENFCTLSSIDSTSARETKKSYFNS